MKFNVTLAVGVLMLAGCSSLEKKSTSAPVPAASPVAAPAAVTKVVANEPNGAEVTCSNGADKRTLTVVNTKPGCELRYLKFGKSVVVATSPVRVEFCDEVQERMKKRLEDSQFSCK